MKKLIQFSSIVALLLTGMALKGQTWKLIGNGIGQDVSFRNDVEVYNNELYVSEAIWNGTTPGTELKVRKWDGQSWASLPSYTTSIFAEFGDMAIYQGDIYVGLVMAGMSTPTLIKYDGTQWAVVPALNVASARSVRSLSVHNGELYIGGYFNFTVGGTTFKNIVKYDGTNFTAIAGLTGQGQVVSDIHFHNGDLYAQAGGTYKWNGAGFGTAVQTVSYANRYRNFLASFNNELYCAADTFFYKIGPSAATLLKTFPFKITDMDVYNGELYLVGDTIRKTWALGGGLVKYDGQNFTTLTSPTGMRSGAVYGGELCYFSSSTTMYNGQQYNRAFKMDATVGLEENINNSQSLLMYPNPARGMFYIENSLNEKQEVKLIDATGKVIRNISLEPEMKAEVRTQSLAPGMYFINNGSNTHRVIITP